MISDQPGKYHGMSAPDHRPAVVYPAAVNGCPVCGGGCPVPCAVLTRHLGHMRLLGRAARTVYDRERAIIRMGRWLAPIEYFRSGQINSGEVARVPVSVLDASAADLAAWRASLSLSPVAIRVYAAHARTFYAWAVTEGIIDSNPALHLLVPPHRRYLPRPIGAESLFTAIDTAPPRIRMWLIFAAFAGLRAAEIAGLTGDCILDGRDPPLIVVRGKGSRERMVPLSSYLLAEIRAAGLPRSGWVFPRRDGRPGACTPGLISKLTNDHLHELGFPDTLHSLRHYFATEAYQGTRDLLTVSGLLGHANVSTTSIYAKFADASAVAAVESIPAPPRLRVVRKDGTA